MSVLPSRATTARIFSPLAYVALLLALIVAVLLTVRTLESAWGHTVPVPLYVGAELLVAGAVLYAGGWELLRLEGLQRPGILDHLRRCALLYALFVPGSVLLVALVDLGDPGGGGALATMLCFAAGYAILVDAALLFSTRRRLDRRGFGRRA